MFLAEKRENENFSRLLFILYFEKPAKKSLKKRKKTRRNKKRTIFVPLSIVLCFVVRYFPGPFQFAMIRFHHGGEEEKPRLKKEPRLPRHNEKNVVKNNERRPALKNDDSARAMNEYMHKKKMFVSFSWRFSQVAPFFSFFYCIFSSGV